MKFKKKALLFLLALFYLINVTQPVHKIDAIMKSTNEVNEKTNVETETEKKKKKKKKKREKSISTPETSPISTDTTKLKLSKVIYNKLNTTFSHEELKEFKPKVRTWDLKLLDKQIEDIYQDMNFRSNLKNTPVGKQSFLTHYVSQFEACDKDEDNVLDLNEFTSCMNELPELAEIIPPNEKYASYINYTYTNSTGFFPLLFTLMDSNNNKYISFYEYMTLRLYRFAWKSCSVVAPFIEEVNFECALDIASRYKTLTRNTLRRLFNLGLELSNSEDNRNMDFMTFATIANGVRIFGKINGKEDNDITKREINLALDSNLLPMRYNQEIIDDMFTLISDLNKPNSGLDISSFVFYDFFLRIYEYPVIMGENKIRKYWLSQEDFLNTLSHHLFPMKIFDEIRNVPRHNLTKKSYDMYTYYNIDQYTEEKDHFLRSFVENEIQVNNNKKVKKKVEWNFDILTQNNTRYEFHIERAANDFFKVLDRDGDNWLNFYDWGNFIQISYLFTKFDVHFKGRIPAGELYEKFIHYSDFPMVSHLIRTRARTFSLLPPDLYVDLLHATLTLRIDDLVSTTVRRTNSATMYEWELKNIFKVVNMQHVPDSYLDKCLRGVDDKNIPLYEWECAFIEALKHNLQFYETTYAYLTTKKMNLALANTVFMNKDPNV